MVGLLRLYVGMPPGGGDASGDRNAPPQVDPGSLGVIVRAFKSSTTLRFHRMRAGGSGQLWQRNYYEHIIRGAADLDCIRAHILVNPASWACDQTNPNFSPLASRLPR